MDIYKIDFTDSTISYVYQDFSENLGDTFYQFFENMRCYSKEIGYKPVNDFLNEIISSFLGEFREYVEKVIREWKESEYCLSKLAIRIGGGQDAEHYALTYMESIEHSLVGVFNKDIPEIHESTSTPVIEKENILKINEEIDILLQKLENVKNQMEQECERRGKENQIISLIKPLLSKIIQGLYEWMKLNKESVIEGADLFERELQDLLATRSLQGNPSSHFSETIIWKI